MGEVSMSTFAGAQVMTKMEADNGNQASVTLPSTATTFWDMPAFLNGYGSRNGHTLQEHLNIEWSAQGMPGTLQVQILNSTDLIRITHTGARQIRLKPGADNHLFGFDNNTTTSYATHLDAPNPWRRGVFQWTQGLDIQIKNLNGTNGNTVRVPQQDYLVRVQSLPTYMRNRSSLTDADNVWDHNSPIDHLGICLEERVQGNMNPTVLFRALVESDGRVTFNFWGGSPGMLDASAWFTSETERRFWTRLGGDMTETAVATQFSRYNLTTANPAPCILAVERGYVELRRKVRTRDDFAMMSDGSVVSAGLAPIRGWDMTLRVIGPAYGYDASLEQHLRDWWQYSRRSLTLYPQWGDKDYTLGACDLRRDVKPQTLVAVSGSKDFFDTFRTPEAHHSTAHYAKRKGGRLHLRRTEADERIEKYSTDLDCYQDIQLKLQDDPTR